MVNDCLLSVDILICFCVQILPSLCPIGIWRPCVLALVMILARMERLSLLFPHDCQAAGLRTLVAWLGHSATVVAAEKVQQAEAAGGLRWLRPWCLLEAVCARTHPKHEIAGLGRACRCSRFSMTSMAAYEHNWLFWYLHELARRIIGAVGGKMLFGHLAVAIRVKQLVERRSVPSAQLLSVGIRLLGGGHREKSCGFINN